MNELEKIANELRRNPIDVKLINPIEDMSKLPKMTTDDCYRQIRKCEKLIKHFKSKIYNMRRTGTADGIAITRYRGQIKRFTHDIEISIRILCRI